MFTELAKNLECNFTEFEEENHIIEDKSFWREFINKVKENDQVEDNKWDFKRTLDMWEIKVEFKEKEKKQIEFCENVISFANSDGGVIIIGITDQPPRKIIGVEDVETKIIDCTGKILRYIRPNTAFYQIKPIQIEDDDGRIKICLLIIIAQTKKTMRVQLDNGICKYYIRFESGKRPIDFEYIEKQKEKVFQTNYRFLYLLKQFLK